MFTLEANARERPIANGQTRLSIAIFSATSFLSALLLFCIEPMFSKMVLPVLGGTSAVWSVAMVVFQGLLLAGYVYAWFITTRLSTRSAMLVHLGVLIAATLCLPVAMSPYFGDPPQHNVAFWLIAFFLASIGLPFFAVAANAPLLQALFARSGHVDAHNPYFLYRASNLGSFLVLLAYPFFVEPALGLQAQSRLWSVGYGLLTIGIVACGFMGRSTSASAAAIATEPCPKIAWRDRCGWTMLAIIPSGLLVAVTAHISTDVASAPFLWVAPLALYLLTFVLAFSDRPLVPLRWLIAVQPATVGALVYLLLWGPVLSWGTALLCNLAVFFVAAMLCHTLLFRSRPPAVRLTEFYVWMSLGGMLGGIFAALVAPRIFNTVLEYPMLVLLAFAMRPDLRGIPAKKWLTDPGAAVAIFVLLAVAYSTLDASAGLKFYAYGAITVAAILPALVRRPSLILSVATLLLLVTNLFPPGQDIIDRRRSFFGVYKVLSQDNGAYHQFFNGTTSHGVEQMLGLQGKPITGSPDPLAYYYHGGALGNAVEAARRVHPLHRVAEVGLGIGSMSCYREPHEVWTFYELDPVVVQIAKDQRLFRSFSVCARDAPVVMGDARLTLKTASANTDVLILDAFASDSVPVHLLTREAFALYKLKLAPHGVIIFHISNRNLELADVVTASAAANGMTSAVHYARNKESTARKFTSEVVVVTQTSSDLSGLRLGRDWAPSTPKPAFRTWTDDYSNILGALLQRLDGPVSSMPTQARSRRPSLASAG